MKMKEILEPALKDFTFSCFNTTEFINQGNSLKIIVDDGNRRINICFAEILDYTVVDAFYVFDTVYDEQSFYKYFDKQFSNVIYRIVDDDYMNGKKFLVVTEKFYIEVVATKDFEISEV